MLMYLTMLKIAIALEMVLSITLWMQGILALRRLHADSEMTALRAGGRGRRGTRNSSALCHIASGDGLHTRSPPC